METHEEVNPREIYMKDLNKYIRLLKNVTHLPKEYSTDYIANINYILKRLKDILDLSEKEYFRIIKKKNEVKPWETIIVAENLTWEKFSKVNSYLYLLSGVKPVLAISRNYPFKENFTHVLGYVSQANKDDILNNEKIKEKFVPGLKVGKIGLEKSLEEKLIGSNDIERYEVNAMVEELINKNIKKVKKEKL